MTLEGKLALQEQGFKTISDLETRLTPRLLNSLSATHTETSITQLNSLWFQLSQRNEKIFLEHPEVLKLPYHLESRFTDAYARYCTLSGLLANRKDEIQAAQEAQAAANQSRVGLDATQYFATAHSTAKLPQIRLPTFSGDYQQWSEFRDLFTALIKNDETLSGSQKMSYLRTQLKDDALSLLANMTLTDDSFPIAWKLLETRYSNPRRVLATYLEELLSNELISDHSAHELDTMLLTSRKALDAIRSMKIKVDNWDPILIHVTLRRLPVKLREEWETTLGLSNDIPKYEQLHDFLKSRVRAWENSEISPTGTPLPENKKSANKSFAKALGHRPSSSTAKSPANSAVAATRQVYFTPAEITSEPGRCPLCKEKHYVLFCKKYQDATVDQRIQLIKEFRLCWNCLGRHRSVDCRTEDRCHHCHMKHHTTIHQLEKKNSPNAAEAASDYSLNNTSLLATATAYVNTLSGDSHLARILIDPGSELSFMTNSLHKKLGLPLKRADVALRAIGNVSAGRTLGSCTIRMKSLNRKNSLNVQVHILSVLSVNLPSFTLIDQQWSHLEGLELADPQFLKSRPIDIILGAGPVAYIMNERIRKGPTNSPIAQSTLLGWIIYGPVSTPTSLGTMNSLHVASVEMDLQLNELIAKFWEQEESRTSESIRYSDEDSLCEEHFKTTHTRSADGRYIVRLPVKKLDTPLGDSFRSAQYSLRRILKRLEADKTLSELYHTFMKEYEQLGHMKRIPLNDLPSNCYFLPHHGVLREQSTTTKLRVVFNGSCCTSTGISLNDMLHVGPKVQIDICDVLLRIRCHAILFGTDITKMFRQINVDSQDWPLQCILWKTNDHTLAAFSLTTVTYGTTSAPYLAVRSLLQLVEDEGEKYPLAIAPMTETRYVDDIYGGADTEDEAIEIARQTKDLCASGCFPLAKWSSNSSRLLATMSPGENNENSPREIGDTTVKVLGIGWNPHQDVFQFNYSLPADSPTTKRAILSEIARLYDPLGLLAPVVITAKVFMQELWLDKLAWDDILSPAQIHKWSGFREDLRQLSSLRIPRWNQLYKQASVELHGFSDASQLAMAAAIYLKVTDAIGRTSVTLLCTKTQVAPLKPLTIPRLELNAAVLLAKLTRYVKNTLKLENVQTYLWTDSAVTLAWINSQAARWKTYVRNRVVIIQENSTNASWKFIAGKQNPADCASRGLSVSKLLEYALWWSGPSWISKSPEDWPTFSIPYNSTEHIEERPGLSFVTFASTDSHPLQTLLERCSTYSKLLRVLGICLRAISRFRKVPHSSLATPLAPGDLETAKNLLIKFVQGQYFEKELRLLADGCLLQKSHNLAKLTPYMDCHGILRVGGRLKNSLLDRQQKHPAILPKHSLLTSMLIDHSHKRTFHGGTQQTLADLRRSVWIIGGRVPVRSYILRCVICVRHRGTRAQQLMGQLPPARVTPSRAFLHTGLDYAGPVTLKAFQGRGTKTYKAWIAVFVCFATSAIHIEIVTDYSSEAFIAAYRRFASRRGIADTIYSDCGTNFVGADVSLKRNFAAGSQSLGDLASLLAKDGTNWKFNPPGAPHFGGKWEAAVKSIKFHLSRTIGEHLMTYEQLATLLTQIEAVLNSRPLAPLSEDPADLEVLTPGHFLIGQPLTAVPEPSLPPPHQTTLQGYKLIQQLHQHFWRRWSSEVLQRHQGIAKWHHPSNEIQVGTMVLITDERFPPTKWPLARVLAVHPGKDKLTRVVTLKTATTELVRPISKLCVLPVYSQLLDLTTTSSTPGRMFGKELNHRASHSPPVTRSKTAALTNNSDRPRTQSQSQN